MIEVPLGKYGKWHAIIDDADFDLISKYRWTRLKGRNDNSYAVSLDEPKVSMHRLILNPDKHELVDHINHNGLDNRRSNIRVCNKSQNCSNRRPRKNASSKYLGVSKSGHKWSADVVPQF